MIVTVFKHHSETDKPYKQSLQSVLDRFKSEDKNGIEVLKTLSTDEYKKQKTNLPGVCFGGLFSKRSKNALIKASGFMIIDIDNLGTKSLAENFTKLVNDEYIYSVWRSPSGRGLKALVKIPVVKNDAEYKLYFDAFSERHKNIDQSGKDISRLCFFCYDTELHQKDSKLWDKKREDKQPQRYEPNYTHNNYKVASRVLNIIRNAVEGERHDKILKAARLMGGYVAGNEMQYDEAFRLLLQEANKISDEHNDSEKDILDGLKYGMNDPLTDKEVQEQVKQEETVQKYGKIFYRALDKAEELDELYKNGNIRGYEIGFNDLNNHYTVKLGSTTYVYGAPASGKTQIWFEFLICLSEKHGLNHCIFSPETGSATEIFAEIVSMVGKGDFTNTYKNQIPFKTAQEAMVFVDKHFFIIDPSDNLITHHDFFDYVDEIERAYNIKIHTSTIDPFNEFKQDLREYSGRQDFYLENVLTEVRQNAKLRNRHNCIITHVQDQQLRQHKTKKDLYYYPLPTYREIAGGQAWSRKGMSMLSVWRPKTGCEDENGDPYLENETVLAIQKSKPKGTGTVGTVSFLYDIKKHRYTDIEGRGITVKKQEVKADYQYSEHIEKPYGSFDMSKANDILDEFENGGKAQDAPF